MVQTVAEAVLPAVATGTGIIVRVKIATAAGHAPPSLTVMKSVMGPPMIESLCPKWYVGVAVPPLVKVPSPLELHNFVPLADVYPAGTVYRCAVAHAVAVVVAPGVATGCFFMIRTNETLADAHGLVPVTVMVSWMMPPLIWSFEPNQYVGVVVVFPAINPSPVLPLVHKMGPLVAVNHPGGMEYDPSVTQAMADVAESAIAVAAATIVRANVAVAGGHAPPSETVMVRVVMPPCAISFGPKKYVGVVLVEFPKVPSPVEVHEMVPFVAAYPPGILKEVVLLQRVAVVVLPADAVGKSLMVRKNWAVTGGHGLVPVTVMVSVLIPLTLISLGPKV